MRQNDVFLTVGIVGLAALTMVLVAFAMLGT
jgi:hypothetical protein